MSRRSPFSSSPDLGSDYYSDPFTDSKDLSPCASKARWKPRRQATWRVPFKLLTAALLCAWALWWLVHDDYRTIGGLSRDLLVSRITKNLQFIPASNTNIYYVGRWTPTSNRLRKDGAFPGVYFDLVLQNTSSLYLSLHNSASDSKGTNRPIASAASNPRHMSFRSFSSSQKAAQPVSLLVRVDREGYVRLQDASGLVAVRQGDLDPASDHNIRVIAPGVDSNGEMVVELEGVWLSKGGRLASVNSSGVGLQAELPGGLQTTNAQGLRKGPQKNGADNELSDEFEGAKGQKPNTPRPTRKIVEVVTDTTSIRQDSIADPPSGPGGLLSAILGWEYLVGEMFHADPVRISVPGMCVLSGCNGGQGQPATVSDVFFRSGPVNTTYFRRPWMFRSYTPSAVVLNLGSTDAASFDAHLHEYKRSLPDLHNRFEAAYVAFIKTIRQQAYPIRTSGMYDDRPASDRRDDESACATLPIFVMRPLDGQLQHSMQTVVQTLRADGDKAVFWIDTSGWLDSPEDIEGGGLSLMGNRKVALYMHAHLCRALASNHSECPFFIPEEYVGKAYIPSEDAFDHVMEAAKVKKLRKVFWGED